MDVELKNVTGYSSPDFTVPAQLGEPAVTAGETEAVWMADALKTDGRLHVVLSIEIRREILVGGVDGWAIPVRAPQADATVHVRVSHAGPFSAEHENSEVPIYMR